MTECSLTHKLVLACVLVMFAMLPASAESVSKKWRLGLNVGGHMPQAEIPSDAANTLTLFDRDLEFAWELDDPREDSSIFGTLEIQPGTISNLSVQYALDSVFVIEGSIGYSQTDLGQAEVQVRFAQSSSTGDLGLDFHTFRVPVGELAITPIQLSGMARFRPNATFNPYIGGGIGYQIVRHGANPEFRQLSQSMEDSLGIQTRIFGPSEGMRPTLDVPQGPILDLQGAVVDAPDTLTWHAMFGGEYTFKRRWALVVDFRYVRSSRTVTIGFNDGEDLGIAVPELSDFVDSPAANQTYGPMWIPTGGIIDGGRLVPRMGYPEETTDCRANPQFCVFEVGASMRDGVADPGFYYVNGGQLDYDAFNFTVGVRYTFK